MIGQAWGKGWLLFQPLRDRQQIEAKSKEGSYFCFQDVRGEGRSAIHEPSEENSWYVLGALLHLPGKLVSIARAAWVKIWMSIPARLPGLRGIIASSIEADSDVVQPHYMYSGTFIHTWAWVLSIQREDRAKLLEPDRQNGQILHGRSLRHSLTHAPLIDLKKSPMASHSRRSSLLGGLVSAPLRLKLVENLGCSRSGDHTKPLCFCHRNPFTCIVFLNRVRFV